MRKKFFLGLRHAFFPALGLVLAWVPIHNVSREGWRHIGAALEQARYFLLIPVIILYLLSHWCRAIRWKIMIGPLGYKPSSLHTFYAVLIGYLTNLGLPRMGEVIKCSVLGRHEKIPIEQLLGTILVERAFDLVCLVLVFVAAIAFQAGDISHLVFHSQAAVGATPSHNGWIRWAMLASILLAAVLLWYLIRKHGWEKIRDVVRKLALGMWQGIYRIRFMKKKGWFLFHTVLIWVLYLICTRLGLYAMKDLDSLGMSAALSVLGVGSIGMVVTPGGVGAYPLLVQKTLVFFGITPDISWAAGYLLWGIPTIIILIGGVLSFAALPPFPKAPAFPEDPQAPPAS